jgi:hypothetical protein
VRLVLHHTGLEQAMTATTVERTVPGAWAMSGSFWPRSAVGMKGGSTQEQGDVPTTQSKGSGMQDANFLRDSLKAAAKEPLNICKLCGAIINRSYQDAHYHGHG